MWSWLWFAALQQGVMCSGRRGGDEDNDDDGNGNVKALLRIAKGVFLGVRLKTHALMNLLPPMIDTDWSLFEPPSHTRMLP